jgi:hypothetical protein
LQQYGGLPIHQAIEQGGRFKLDPYDADLFAGKSIVCLSNKTEKKPL